MNTDLRLLFSLLFALSLAACGEGDAPSPDPDDMDLDGDGWFGRDDCDDNDPNSFPGADELCDGEDQDCDGIADDGLESYDGDLDGSGCMDDCDDADSSIYPGAYDVPDNGIDEDCDGVDAEASECASPDTASASAPLVLDVSGDQNISLSFDQFECEDYGGDNWKMSWTSSDSDWLLRVVAGPMVDGEVLDSGISITFMDVAAQAAVYSGNTMSGHDATLTPQGYIGSSPCGSFTTAVLPATSSTGASMALSPQPIPFRCP